MRNEPILIGMPCTSVVVMHKIPHMTVYPDHITGTFNLSEEKQIQATVPATTLYTAWALVCDDEELLRAIRNLAK